MMLMFMEGALAGKCCLRDPLNKPPHRVFAFPAARQAKQQTFVTQIAADDVCWMTHTVREATRLSVCTFPTTPVLTESMGKG